MRRDYFTIDASNLDTPGVPTVVIDFEGPTEQLVERLTRTDGEPLASDEVDVAFRLQGPVKDDPEGVVAVTNRVTGEFVLELNADSEDVLNFIEAAREYGKEAGESHRYRIRVSIDGDQLLEQEKGTFLVYDANGDLLRHHSLIPSGVEL
ncbi:hypothetical protein DM867_10845 [Halosegnis rubeus]|jgi:hypothetical protein|uniref:Uncharacterized protein n=1 Tax=Halosegnis rubeus TaxID=2212850 RepID=A0A5N5UDK9_9EURY|nr:DUF5793 family protein [Halosegnis rubeus]KAB7513002.1 hypothetical protein DM867_10845 [Halosegnis rubeus]KAB7513140.1 hypothetical protein DMP03_13050 [Halosegnis rubeus]KAB7516630.1 hypothetical protein DP108_10935 [Halosegnis rubeus]